MQIRPRNKWPIALFVGVLITSLLAAGCGKKQSAPASQEVAVKAIQVIQQDTPITYEFIGEVEAKDEVQIRSNVSGTIIDKMVKGGEVVYKGQPLFRIDGRQYHSMALNTQAQLAEAEAALSRIRRDVARYRTLAEQNAIAEQVLDNILAEEQQAVARVEAYRAAAARAEIDLGDTLVVAPMDGKIDMKDLSVGSYVVAGSTVLATMSSSEQVRVKFNMSETEYLKFARMGQGNNDNWGQEMKLILSDGSQYPFSGKIEQIDRALANQTGTMTLKALFDNPERLLVPGMFARVQTIGETRVGALMIPQRAVQELIGKTLVTVVGEGDKAEQRVVKMGPRIGSMWVVEEGLTAQDRVVVEGIVKTQPGMQLKVTMIGPDDLNKADKK
ncbi:MAG: efflux RND transporter periplasmic adaptor subunit [Negativicutes bacterium]